MHSEFEADRIVNSRSKPSDIQTVYERRPASWTGPNTIAMRGVGDTRPGQRKESPDQARLDGSEFITVSNVFSPKAAHL